MEGNSDLIWCQCNASVGIPSVITLCPTEVFSEVQKV